MGAGPVSAQLALFDAPPSSQAVRAHFDRDRAARRREEGVQLTETANKEFVSKMREYAIEVCRRKGQVHIDDVRRHALALGVKPASSAAWGAIFRGKGWKQIGLKASELVTNHGHKSPIWTRTD